MSSSRTICSMALAAAIGSAGMATAAYSEPMPARGPIPFSAYDQNSDGVIDKNEFDTVRAKLKNEGRPMRNALSFTDLDQNGDGKISAEEFAAAHAARPRGPGMGGGMQGNMPDFSEFDLNKDGKVTEAEFTDARTARITKRLQEGYQMRGLANAPSFEDIDTNHDGAISPEEFAVQRAEHRKQMRQ